MDNDDSDMHGGGGGGGEREGYGQQPSGERVNQDERIERSDVDGGMKVDVNLNLGLGGEPSSSSSMTATTGRENSFLETQNKRPRVHSFSLYQIPMHEEVSYENLHQYSVVGDNSTNHEAAVKMDDMEVRMDLTDDLLHMVFSFLGHIDLCQAAAVCRQWRDASCHEDFWRNLNFKNRPISVQQFADICRRYPNANDVNVYGTRAVYRNGMKAISSLRNLGTLTLGKGQLDKKFFEALTDCRALKKLIIIDAALGNEIPIYHDGLHELRIVKCRVLRISVRCQQLETLSLRRSSMPQAVLNCPNLRQLDIASCHKLSDAAIRSAATPCRLLESLDMANCSRVSDETLREIAYSCRDLRILDASYCPNISLESVRLSMLTVLKLHSCEGITSASMAAIALFHMLEVLELDNCSLLTSISLDLSQLKSISLVHCRKLVDLNLRSRVLSVIAVSNCPSLQRIDITSNALEKLVLQKQESLTTLALQCPCLQDVDLTGCESLTNSICEVFSSNRDCPILRSLVLDSCKSLTALSFNSTSLVNLSLGGCHEITSLELGCHNLEHVSLDGCGHLERAFFSPVNLQSLNLGICPKLNVLHIEAPSMVSLELKGCGVLSEANIHCPLLTSLDASFCSQLKDDDLKATISSCPGIESLVLMLCTSVCPDGLSSLNCLSKLTYLDLSYNTFLVNLQPVFDSCICLKVLKLQACKYLSDTSLEPLYKGGALPYLCELDLSSVVLSRSAIEELLAGCMHLTHVSLNGCVNMHDLDWGLHLGRPSEINQIDRQLQHFDCVGCPNIKKVVIPPTASFHLTSLNLSLSSNLKEVDISCSNLLNLCLSHCNSLEILKLDCPKLTSLSLQSCNVDVETVETAIKRCNMLETLDVRFCPKISPLSMSTLRAACPGLKRIYNSLASA